MRKGCHDTGCLLTALCLGFSEPRIDLIRSQRVRNRDRKSNFAYHSNMLDSVSIVSLFRTRPGRPDWTDGAVRMLCCTHCQSDESHRKRSTEAHSFTRFLFPHSTLLWRKIAA
ncbi:hypothetical protein IG631_21229 [Alternaria alternata]|nr:hypothetical protein IG631_21229 [Alternaria alternata]